MRGQMIGQAPSAQPIKIATLVRIENEATALQSRSRDIFVRYMKIKERLMGASTPNKTAEDRNQGTYVPTGAFSNLTLSLEDIGYTLSNLEHHLIDLENEIGGP